MKPVALGLMAACLLWGEAALADPVDDLVETYRAASHIPGVSVAVIEDGRITTLRGYGQADLAWPGAVTPDTPFQTASASKIFAGVVLMRLAEQGRLSLDDPIAGFFDGAPETWSRITVRQLAAHTSGLAEVRDLPANATPQDVVARAMQTPLAFEPGSQSRYGLTDFVVMTAIMEKVSGLAYPDLVRTEVSEPLGLKNTGFSMLRDDGSVRSSVVLPGSARVYGWRNGAMRDEEFIYPIRTYAAGGLFSSARDIATLMLVLEKGELLSSESFSLLTSPARLNDGREGAFGVGWTFERYRGLQTVGHTGGPALADVMYVPERGLTVVALTNQRRFYPLLSHAIADLVLPASEQAEPIADDRPERTEGLRRTLEAAALGALDAAVFTDTAREGLMGFYGDFGQAMLIAVGPVKTVQLVSERSLEDGKLRRLYRVDFERRALEFVVRTDADGRFEEIRPLSGDDVQ